MLSVKFDPAAGETIKLQVMFDKVKELHKWMKVQGCKNKFGLEELAEMARNMSVKGKTEAVPEGEVNKYY